MWMRYLVAFIVAVALTFVCAMTHIMMLDTVWVGLVAVILALFIVYQGSGTDAGTWRLTCAVIVVLCAIAFFTVYSKLPVIPQDMLFEFGIACTAAFLASFVPIRRRAAPRHPVG